MPAVDDVVRRDYGGQTGDERAARRRAALVDTAFALVAEHGWRGLRIDAVCRGAGLNKRYFYESFDGVEALIAAVTAQIAENAITVTLAALDEGGTRDESTRRAIIAFVGHVIEDPRRARVLFGAVPAGDAAAGHRAAAIRRLTAMIAARGSKAYELSGVSPAVELSAAMLIGGTSQAILDWLDGRVACTSTELVEDLVVLWQAVGEATTVLAGEQRRQFS